MTRDYEASFSQWAQSPSTSEQTRSENAIKVVRNAIDADKTLGPRLRKGLIKPFVQGSYRNRVNVRADSDVDVGILYTGSFFAEYPVGYGADAFGHEAATYSFRQFKDDLEQALVAYLGAPMVTRGNKAINIRETSYHVEADAAPFFEHRLYSNIASPPLPGVELRPDDNPGKRIINFPEALFSTWPDEHYENGRDKNHATHRRYRGVVRILKKLRNEMEDSGYMVAKPIPGYLIECLTWNTPNTCFDGYTWYARVQAVLAYLWSHTKDGVSCNSWREVDDIKPLFDSSQPWRHEQAHAFINAAWDYVGVPSR